MENILEHRKVIISLQGFTLIELLVTMSIISVLASIVIGGVSTARQKATDVAAIQTSRNILYVVLDCIDNSNTVLHLNNSNTGGGSVCNAGMGATIPWPKLPTGWVWIPGFPASAPADSKFVIEKTVDGYLYYIGCGYFGCKLTGPNSPHP